MATGPLTNVAQALIASSEPGRKKGLSFCGICGMISFVDLGLVAQLGERCTRIAEAEGSSPFKSTIFDHPGTGVEPGVYFTRRKRHEDPGDQP